MKPRLIGLVGYSGSGKTRAAKILMSYGYVRERCAGPLKKMLKAMGLTHKEVDGCLRDQPCELLGGKTPRDAMITLGTEWGRQMIDKNLWVRILMRRVDHLLMVGADIVIDDVRFQEEAQAIKGRGGVIWRIDRPGVGPGSAHISETGQSDIVPDKVIVNDGDDADLIHSVWVACQEYNP